MNKKRNKHVTADELETLLSRIETREEAIEVLTEYAEKHEKILSAGGMTVPKRREIARKSRVARALLRELSSTREVGPKERKPAKAAIANYFAKRVALLRQLGLPEVPNVD